MVNISKPLTTNTIGNYFKNEYLNSENRYYSQDGAVIGQWHGDLAKIFGLVGAVRQEHFERLANGQHPITGKQLIAHRDTIKTKTGEEIGHRAAWDLAFSAPKSVSLTGLVGGDQRIIEAHRESVTITLDYAQKWAQARMGGDRPSLTTENWAAALFDHDTARPVDGYSAPQLHTHVVVFNMTDAHGQIRSLQPQELYRIQTMMTAVYQAELGKRLRSFGYQLEKGENHAPEIKGYTAEYKQSESLRRQAIVAEMDAKGLKGAAAASIVAHSTRDSKQILNPAEQRSKQQERAAVFGDQPSLVVEIAAQRKKKEISPEQIVERSKSAVEFAEKRLSEREAVFDQYEVVRDSLRHGNGKIVLANVLEAIEEHKSGGHFQEVAHVRPHSPQARYTTPTMIDYERKTIEFVKAGIGKDQAIAPTMTKEYMREYLARDNGKGELNNGQLHAAYGVFHTTDKVFGLQGKAGVGKTTLLKAVDKAAKEHGYDTKGLAPTSKAVQTIRDVGVDADTLQKHLMTPKTVEQDPTCKPVLYYLDESSLASTKQIHEFLLTLKPPDRVMLIGDSAQHQSVEAGRIFEELQQAGMPTYRLGTIVRQRLNPELKEVVKHLAAGQVEPAMTLLDEQNGLREVAKRSERFQAIAREYILDPDHTLVVSPDNESRKELNKEVRKAMKVEDLLGSDKYSMEVLINRQDITCEDRKMAGSYDVGNIVRFARGSKLLGIEPGTYVRVLASNRETNEITVQMDTRRILTYAPTKKASGVQVFTTEQRSFAEGDRIQFTAPWRAKAVNNRDRGTVTHIDEHGNIAVQLDESKRTVAWNLKNMKHVDHGYAMTSYSSQGTTVEKVLVQMDAHDSRVRGMLDKTLAYVAISRASHNAIVFTDSKQDLIPALNKHVSKSKALSPEQIKQYTEPAQVLQQAPKQLSHLKELFSW